MPLHFVDVDESPTASALLFFALRSPGELAACVSGNDLLVVPVAAGFSQAQELCDALSADTAACPPRWRR